MTSSYKHVLHFGIAAGAFALGLGAGGGAAFAQTTEQVPPKAAERSEADRSDVVVVTARRREEDIQDVPAAVTAFGGELLEDLQIKGASDLQRLTPSLSIGGGNSVYGSNNSNYSIRGLGQGLFGGPSVISYFGEAPFGPTGPGMPFFDIGSVQVLKGPQGTLFGRASVGGAVIITPQAPTFDSFYGSVDTTLGSMGRSDANLMVNIPISDAVALRVALNRTHVDGWVEDITTGQDLAGSNSQSARVSLAVRPFDWLENDFIYNYFSNDQMLSPRVLVGANTGVASLNRGPAAFTAVCTQAVALGFATDVPSCQSERVAALAAQRAALTAEVARTSRGGGELFRSTHGVAFPQTEQTLSNTFVNTTRVELPDVGMFSFNLKNIFSFQQNKNLISGDWNGTSLDVNGASFCVSPFSPNTGCGSSAQWINGRSVASMGRFNDFYSNEFQINGDIDSGFINWIAGYYMQQADVPLDIDGSALLNQTFGGVGTPNRGPLSAAPMNISGQDREFAYFGQFTADLSRFSLQGVSFTAGYRQTESRISRTTAAAVVTYPDGFVRPGARSTLRLEGDGPSWNVAVDWKVSPDLLLYATQRRGYKPGGANSSVGAQSVPGYVPFYKPESVIDVEVGAKWDFDLNGMEGRLNVAAFRDDYDDIQRGTSAINSTGNFFAFTNNVAAARLQGVELEGFIAPTDDLTLSATYSYSDAKYTEWTGSDPLGAVPAGTLIDLSGNPFGNAPKNKASITVAYDLPVSTDLGQMSLSATAFGQDRIWLTDLAARNLEVYGPVFGQDVVKGWLSEDGYVAVNARLDWREPFGQPFDIAFYARNLTDEVYAVAGGMSLNSVGTANKIFNQPREVGVQLVYRFGD